MESAEEMVWCRNVEGAVEDVIRDGLERYGGVADEFAPGFFCPEVL